MRGKNNRWGAIDIGSNSVRFLAAELTEGGLKTLWRRLDTTRLGREVARSGDLHPEAVQRTLDVLATGLEAMASFGVQPGQVAAFATSAVREAGNGVAFCRRVGEELSLSVTILSGEREGHLSYEGAVDGLPGELVEGRIPVVVDIGGGSAEVVFRNGDWWRRSFPLGAVRLTESRLGKADVARLWAPAAEAIGRLRDLGGEPVLVGVGGTATTAAAIALELTLYDPERVQGYFLSLERLRAIGARLRALDLEARRQTPGLQPERADIILAGLLALETLLESANGDGFIASETDLLHCALKRRAAGQWPPEDERAR
ncbi:Ppx/GppA family phosphatase [Heliobacterium gestii]|uniref:Ppx/GppA family phosphatase n=1 Tax=Heliomicrobium gestii TaxID=2699 RepID=A0A845LDV5_HELGE|nr:Ppx/GppA family phosphatase [Heliomicrobium gestii]MBM7866407.1 exopolyphosphatase/guanosine-5'-triphosphate,3'-diphosphate pyrophosphatase [Heliomicrobium gestii]MZP42809.1 Ppx/GppA family phosphatase [Heliomicrobium gestii]